MTAPSADRTMRLALLAVLLTSTGCGDDISPVTTPAVGVPLAADSAGGGVDTTDPGRIEAEIDVVEGALNGEVIP
ncbi:MAG TPA: hypothetical protein VF576_08100 [Rubricoccaceae bacterium]|jgi:hypothetical protein